MNYQQNSEPWPEVPWYVPDWVLDGTAPPAPPVGLRRQDAAQQVSDGLPPDGWGITDGAGQAGPGSTTSAAGVSDDDDELPLEVWRRLAADARFDLNRAGSDGHDIHGPHEVPGGSTDLNPPGTAAEPVDRSTGSPSARRHRQPPGARRRRRGRTDAGSVRRRPAKILPALRRYPLTILIADGLVLALLLSWLIGYPTVESFMVAGLGFAAGVLCGRLREPYRRSRHLPISAQRRPHETESARYRDQGSVWRRRGTAGHSVPGQDAGPGTP